MGSLEARGRCSKLNTMVVQVVQIRCEAKPLEIGHSNPFMYVSWVMTDSLSNRNLRFGDEVRIAVSTFTSGRSRA